MYNCVFAMFRIYFDRLYDNRLEHSTKGQIMGESVSHECNVSAKLLSLMMAAGHYETYIEAYGKVCIVNKINIFFVYMCACV